MMNKKQQLERVIDRISGLELTISNIYDTVMKWQANDPIAEIEDVKIGGERVVTKAAELLRELCELNREKIND